MTSCYLEYLIKLLTDDKERAAFQNNPDDAMAKAFLSPAEQFSLKSLALESLSPQEIGSAVLKALERGRPGVGYTPSGGPP